MKFNWKWFFITLGIALVILFSILHYINPKITCANAPVTPNAVYTSAICDYNTWSGFTTSYGVDSRFNAKENMLGWFYRLLTLIISGIFAIFVAIKKNNI